ARQRHRVIWQGSGLRVNRHDSGHRVIRYRIVWLDSGHFGSPGMTAGTGSPGIRSFGLPAGTASSGKAVGTRVTRHCIVWARQRHRVTRHQVIWLASGHHVIWQGSRGHRIRYWIIWINSGYRVNWPNRIVRLDQFIMLGRGIR
ncbi:unnamed protein product, partial [Staurois parvus]